MAGPIGYVPPANPYTTMPIDRPRFTGLGNMPSAEAAGIQAEAPEEQKIKESEAYDTQAQLASQFQMQLNKGISGMQAYINDVQKDNPDLAQHFSQELQTMAPFLQTLKGKDLNDQVFNMYDSWNGRVNSKKLGQVMSDPASTDQDVFGAYAEMGAPFGKKDTHADRLMESYVNNQKVKAMTPYWAAKGQEATARANLLEATPELKTKIAEIQAEGKIRASKLRNNKDNSGYQVSYKEAKDAFDRVQSQIQEFMNSDPSASMPPDTPLWQRNIVRETTGWNKTMNDLTKEQNQWRSAMIRAEAHGAKPTTATIDNPPAVTAPAPQGAPASGAGPANAAPPPPYLKSDSDSGIIMNYLRSLNRNRQFNDQDVEKARAALKAMGR